MYTCTKCGWSGEVKGRQRCLACARVRVKAWRKQNPEKYKAQKQRYDKHMREARREEYNARRRRRRRAARCVEAYRRRLAWLMTGDVTREELILIWEEADGKCSYCGGTLGKPRFNPLDPRGFDHVRPRSRGGIHTRANICACCKDCNSRKSDAGTVES